jgi:hypothetical protein
MAEVERSWFRWVLQREPGAPYLWYDPAIEDSEMIPLDGADWEADLAGKGGRRHCGREFCAERAGSPLSGEMGGRGLLGAWVCPRRPGSWTTTRSASCIAARYPHSRMSEPT